MPVTALANYCREAMVWYYHPRRFRRFCLFFGLVVIFVAYILLYRCRNPHKEPDRDWLNEVRVTLKDKELNVVVVEEHHEVLQYWFSAVHKDLIRPTGNTLVHIDAHSDSAAPALVPGFLRFKTPTTGKEVQLMMQKNDVFILGAMIKDYITKFIWVYPEWLKLDDEVGDRTLKGEKFTIGLGYYTVKQGDENIQGLCACYGEFESQNGECDFIDAGGAQLEDYDGKCDVEKHIAAHLVKESLASHLLPTLLDKSDDSIILDIDEDYYGVMKGTDLVSSVNFTIIQEYNAFLSEIFIIKNTQDESNAHTLMLKILHLVKVTCSPTLDNTRDCNDEQFKQIVKALKESGLEQIPIGGDKISESELKTLVQVSAAAFTDTNIDQLSELGFCLGVSPVSYRMTNDAGNWQGHDRLEICHGINTPLSENQIYVPTAEEVTKTTDRFSSVLKHVPASEVKLVTICRSNRDGFVPRHLQKDIEKDILSSLGNKFKNSNLIYDRNMMTHLGQGIN